MPPRPGRPGSGLLRHAPPQALQPHSPPRCQPAPLHPRHRHLRAHCGAVPGLSGAGRRLGRLRHLLAHLAPCPRNVRLIRVSASAALVYSGWPATRTPCPPQRRPPGPEGPKLTGRRPGGRFVATVIRREDEERRRQQRRRPTGPPPGTAARKGLGFSRWGGQLRPRRRRPSGRVEAGWPAKAYRSLAHLPRNRN